MGGQNGNWASVFSAAGGVNNFATSLKDIVGKYNLDGVDLDIESFEQTSTATADLIVQVKQKLLQLGQKILVVSPQCGTIYQGVGVPDPSTNGGNYWNHFVYIVKTVDAYIDYYQVQAYNDWYEFPGGSLQYLQNVYLNWRNLQGLSQWGSTPIANFGGVKASKLVLGVMSSPSAGIASFYTSPSTLLSFRSWLTANGYTVGGYMTWDSHWDSLNGNVVTNAIAPSSNSGSSSGSTGTTIPISDTSVGSTTNPTTGSSGTTTGGTGGITTGGTGGITTGGTTGTTTGGTTGTTTGGTTGTTTGGTTGTTASSGKVTSIYSCSIGSGSASSNDDVSSVVSSVLLAFAEGKQDGTVAVDQSTFP